MKKLLAVVILAAAGSAFAGGEIKEVCVNKKDNTGRVIIGKDDKPIKECKKIKVHKKLQGTPVPGQQK